MHLFRVSEDQGMIDSVNLGALTLEKLEAMTCVCSVGLDMIAIPGDQRHLQLQVSLLMNLRLE